MSNQYFCMKWRTTINELMEALQHEIEPLNDPNLKAGKTEAQWFEYYGGLYLFYVDCYKGLEECYDQLVHPQKRKLLKKMLENNMVRIIQVRQNLTFYSMEQNVIRSEFINLHDLLQSHKRLMQSAEVTLPRYFVDNPPRRLEYRNQLVEKLLSEFHDNTAPEEEVLAERLIIEQNIELAVTLIQKADRGRQGIERVMLAKYLRKQDIKKMEKHRKMQEGIEIAEDQEREEALLVIQKYYRGYRAREVVTKLRETESMFLGFEREAQPKDTEDYKFYEQHRQEVKLKQQERLQEYKEALIDAKDQLAEWTDDIKQNMLDDRRHWYMKEVFKVEGKLVPPKAAQFYKKDEVRLPLTPEEQEALDILDKEKKAAKKNKGKKKKKKKAADEDVRVEMGPGEEVIKLQDNIQCHNKEWRKDLYNFEQKHEQGLLRDEIAKDVEKQIRLAVDDMIDMELVNLRLAMKAKKFKYPKKKKSKKKKAKKDKKPYEDNILDDGDIVFEPRSVAKKKKKMPGDKYTNKKDPRDMLAELIEAGVVKKLEPAKLADLLGDPNPMRKKLEALQEQVADPSMFDLRQVLAAQIGMPLGSPYVKDSIKESNYVLFFGPQGTGKTHAVRALQTECNALVIDLSPSNIENRYTDKPDQLLSLAFKVATCFQPSIIYIDEIERIFKGKKKKKKGEAVQSGGMNWVKMRKFLVKYGKYFTEKSKENVTVIGCTNQPWAANKKQLKSFFKKRVYFPCPDYSTRVALFRKFFESKNITLHPNFPLSTLAHVTEGFTAGNIKEALNKVLTSRRMLLKDEIPYRIQEFVDPMSVQQNTYLQKYLEFRKFHDEMSGNKARIDKLRKPEGDDKKKKTAKKKK